jgi:hypothetical protein
MPRWFEQDPALGGSSPEQSGNRTEFMIYTLAGPSAEASTILVLQDTLGGGVHKADSQNRMHYWFDQEESPAPLSSRTLVNNAD